MMVVIIVVIGDVKDGGGDNDEGGGNINAWLYWYHDGDEFHDYCAIFTIK
jgi:hypothetical protein